MVITGATSGVGRAVVREFARRGAKIGLVARDEETLEIVAGEVEELGGEPFVMACDVSDAAELDRQAQRFIERFRGIDTWVGNAMVTVFSPVAKIEPDEWRRVIEVNFLGMVYGAQIALERMERQRRGKIVLVGSALAFRGIPLQAPYCASKFAIRGFFESLRCELRHKRSPVSVSMVHLPGLNTPQFSHSRDHMGRAPRPVAPVYQPEVAAKAIYAAAHSSRRELWVGRSTVMTVLAERIAPGILERYLAKTAWAGQLTDERISEKTWPENLFEAAPGDPGAHGPFDDEAKSRSLQLDADLHRGLIGAGTLLVAGITAAAASGTVRNLPRQALALLDR